MLCHLLTHARLQGLASTAGFLFDAAMAWADELTEEQRAAMLARTQAGDTPRVADGHLAYLFGAPAAHDGWLKVVLPSSPAAATVGAVASPGTTAPPLASPGARPIGGTPQAAGAARPMQQQRRWGARESVAGPQSPGVRGGGAARSSWLAVRRAGALGRRWRSRWKHWELLPPTLWGRLGSAANDTLAISLALSSGDAEGFEPALHFREVVLRSPWGRDAPVMIWTIIFTM